MTRLEKITRRCAEQKYLIGAELGIIAAPDTTEYPYPDFSLALLALEQWCFYSSHH